MGKLPLATPACRAPMLHAPTALVTVSSTSWITSGRFPAAPAVIPGVVPLLGAHLHRLADGFDRTFFSRSSKAERLRGKKTLMLVKKIPLWRWDDEKEKIKGNKECIQTTTGR